MNKKFLAFLKGIEAYKGKSDSELEEIFKAMEPEEIAGHYNDFNEETSKALHEAIDKKLTEEVEKLKSELTEQRTEQMKVINEALKAQGIAITKLTTAEKAEYNNDSFGGSLRKHLEANKDALIASKDSGMNAESIKFTVKVAGTMTITGNVSGGNVPVEDRIEGMNAIASRQIRFLDVLSKRSTTSKVVSWVFQANKDGAAGGTAEAAAKNQIDFDLVVNSETVKKRTAFIKVSTEMLDDIDFIESEIRTELMRELMKDIENQAYQGDGTGTNLNGIRTVATAFAAGTFATSVDNANAVDVLTVALNQIDIAEQPMANFIFMHPSDLTALKLVKLTASDKRYVDRLITVGSTLVLDGVPIIKTTLVAVDDYLVGAFDLAVLVARQEIRIDIGIDGNDFTNNVRTILAEWRGLTFVKNNDRTAFVEGDFTTDAAALETP